MYVSASIYGLKDENHVSVPLLVEYIMTNGGDVLDEHIRGKDLQEMNDIVYRRTGVNRLEHDEPWRIVHQQDVDWVDASTHMIIFVDGPSHGVGMELMRGLLKSELGLNRTPILILIQEENLPKLSLMVRGIPTDKYPVQLETYRDFNHVKELVDEFLNPDDKQTS